MNKTTRDLNLMVFIILGFALITGGCDHDRCVQGNKELLKEQRSVSSFSGLVSKGSFDVTIIESETTEVWVEAESNLLPYISTRVTQDDLVIKIRESRCLQNNLPFRVHVYAPTLNRVKLEGSGYIEAEALTGHHVRAQLSGSGDIRAEVDCRFLDASIAGSGRIWMAGRTEESEMSISGSGDIRSHDLQQDVCFANITGSGSMYVNVTQLLDVRITGSGSVYYMGRPDVNARITGTGKVYHTR